MAPFKGLKINCFSLCIQRPGEKCGLSPTGAELLIGGSLPSRGISRIRGGSDETVVSGVHASRNLARTERLSIRRPAFADPAMDRRSRPAAGIRPRQHPLTGSPPRRSLSLPAQASARRSGHPRLDLLPGPDTQRGFHRDPPAQGLARRRAAPGLGIDQGNRLHLAGHPQFPAGVLLPPRPGGNRRLPAPRNRTTLLDLPLPDRLQRPLRL